MPTRSAPLNETGPFTEHNSMDAKRKKERTKNQIGKNNNQQKINCATLLFIHTAWHFQQMKIKMEMKSQY